MLFNMNLARTKAFTRRPPVILVSLLIVAILAFWGVNHLVVRFREQQKALARRMYRRGQEEESAGRPDRAIENFRAALGYSRDNFQYQLSLARALRDTNRIDEAQAYLISLWERAPQDSTVNLALGRLAARRGSVDDVLRYYHNAMYGAWPADGDKKRRDTQFELIEYLLTHNAISQAQAELISMAATLPPDPDLHLRVAQLFVRSQDYQHALDEFQRVLSAQRQNPDALAGAGEAAFQLGRYRSAHGYLQSASRLEPKNGTVTSSLESVKLVLQADPFARRISERERRRRIGRAFEDSGKRLEDCAKSKGIDLSSPAASGELQTLRTRWNAMKNEVARARAVAAEMPEAAMDLVFQIEQQTAAQCGPPSGMDQALFLLSQNRSGDEP